MPSWKTVLKYGAAMAVAIGVWEFTGRPGAGMIDGVIKGKPAAPAATASTGNT